MLGKKIVKLMVLFLAVSVLNACAGRLKELEDANTRQTKEINDLRSVTAEHSVSLEQIRNDLRRLSGNVEELDFQARGKTAEIQKALDRFSSRVPPPAGVPEDLLVEDEEAVSSNASQSAAVFKDGLQKVRTGDFDGAISALNKFLEANPATIVSDNAMFWVGICQLKLGQPEKAVVTFSDVFNKFPGEDRAPWSLYYLAEVFEKINQREDAKITLQKLVDDFGGSAAARKAEDKLRADYGVKQVPVKKPAGKK